MTKRCSKFENGKGAYGGESLFSSHAAALLLIDKQGRDVEFFRKCKCAGLAGTEIRCSGKNQRRPLNV